MPVEMANVDDPRVQTENGNDSGGEVPHDNDRDAPSANAKRRMKMDKEVQDLIAQAKATNAVVLELNNKGLQSIPEELLELAQMQYLYLAGNSITRLPDNFFDVLPSLRWLDLRNNYLQSLPNAYIGRHANLRTLLLENNQLHTLPLELGLISTLRGLNIAYNPLEFPPREVIERGTQTILAFFRQLLTAKTQGVVQETKPESSSDEEMVPRVEDLKVTDDSDSDSDWGRSPPQQHSAYSRQRQERSAAKEGRVVEDHPDLVGPVPQSASLHKPMSYNELRQVQMERLHKAGLVDRPANKSANKKRRKASKSSDSVAYEGVSPDVVQAKYMEEKKMERLRELREKQDMILQRRKDDELLRSFRDDSRKLQMRKHREKIIKGTIEYEDPAEQAPYAVDEQHMKMPTNQERIAMEIREKHDELRRAAAMSPDSMHRVQQQRRERDRELEKRIKQHTASMQQRKRKPVGTPQEEMHAAMEELRVAEQLELEIAARRKDLEYRFTAFTADLPARSPAKPRLKVKEPLAPITPGR